MAVTLTALELAAALRVGDGTTALTGPLAEILDRLLATATALVNEYSPMADDDVANEACVRLCGFLHDSNPAAVGVSPIRWGYPGPSLSSHPSEASGPRR